MKKIIKKEEDRFWLYDRLGFFLWIIIFSIKMRCKSIDDCRYHKVSFSPSKRSMYVEQQTSKNHDIFFHSPYKNGRPNKEYVNPSLLSSHLFYPKQYLGNKDFNLTKKVSFNDQIEKSPISDSKQPGNITLKELQRQSDNIRIGRFNDPEILLHKELKAIKQHDKIESQQMKIKKNNTNNEYPIYLQKPQNYYKQSTILQKQNHGHPLHQQSLQKFYQRNFQLKRKRCEALTQILKEQIKFKEKQRKELRY